MAETFVRNKEPMIEENHLALKGERKEIHQLISPETPELFYSHSNGELWLSDSVAWLKSLGENSRKTIYRWYTS